MATNDAERDMTKNETHLTAGQVRTIAHALEDASMLIVRVRSWARISQRDADVLTRLSEAGALLGVTLPRNDE